MVASVSVAVKVTSVPSTHRDDTLPTVTGGKFNGPSLVMPSTTKSMGAHSDAMP